MPDPSPPAQRPRRPLRLRARARWTRGWLRRGFWGPTLTLITGSTLAQAATFAARPVLTRLYTPEDFGVATLLVAVSAVLLIAATGRYEDALMLPESDAEARGLRRLAVRLAMLTGAVTTLAVVVAGALGIVPPAWSLALYALGPVVALGGVAGALETWLARRERFSALSASRVLQAIAVVGLQVGVGLAVAGAWGLVLGALAGFATLVGGLAFATFRDGAPSTESERGSLKRLARRYARFPRWSAPAAFLNVLSSRLPVLVLAPVFGAGPVGLFGLAFGSLAMPLGLISSSLGQVFFVQAADAARDGTLPSLARTMHRRLLALTVFPAGVVLLVGPELFAFVFGASWGEAGVYAQWLAPWVALAAVASALTRVFDVTEQQRADLASSLVLLLILATALVAGVLTSDALATVACAGVAGALARLGHAYWALRTGGVEGASFLKGLALEIAWSALPLGLVGAGALAGGIALPLGVGAGTAVFLGITARRLGETARL